MSKKMLIDAAHPEEMRVVITDDKAGIHEFDFTTVAKKQIKGNVYLAKVTRVEPSLQAAFVEYGGNKQGFLPFSEIHPDYYQIPVSDREKLLAEEEEAAAEAEDEEETLDDEELSEPAALAAEAELQEVRSEKVSEEELEEGESEAQATGVEEYSSEGNVEKDTESDSEESSETDSENESETTGDKGEAKDGKNRGRGRSRFRRRGRRNNRNNDNVSEDNEDSDVETIDSEDEDERPKRRAGYSRRYKIQEVIKRNQILLVQITKEERGNKGVSMSTFLSLAGRYCVLMPNSPRGGGISRKISSRDDRKKLKKIISDLTLPKGMSVIVRTAGANRTRIEIRRDFEYLVKVWNQIREDTLVSTAPAIVYEENNLIKRSIRDSYNNDIETILVEGDAAYKEAKAFMKTLVPSHAPKVKHYKDDLPLFHAYDIEEQLLAIYDPVVRLKSGGYLVMNSTEALIAVDVNSGSANRERNVEQTALKTNTEAAREVARQLRLRDLAGLIVIDFIDMMDGKNRRAVEKALKESLRNDRARIQVGRISSFGLLEMSRQRLRPSISESVNLTCEQCNGTGLVRSDAASSIQVIRELEKEAGSSNTSEFRVWVTPSIALYLINNMREDLQTLEGDLGLIICIQIDDALKASNFRIERIKRKDSTQPSSRNNAKKNRRNDDRQDKKTSDAKKSTNEKQAEEVTDSKKEEAAPKKRRTRNRRKKDDDSNNVTQAEKPSDEGKGADESVEKVTDEKASPKKTTSRRARKPRKDQESAKEDADAKKNEDSSGAADASNDNSGDNDSSEVKKAKPRAKQAKAEKASDSEAVYNGNSSEDENSDKPARRGWWQKIIE